MQVSSLFKKSLAYEMGDGRWIKFWEDIWCGERSLKQNFTDVFSMVADPMSIVAANFFMHGGEVVWAPILRGICLTGRFRGCLSSWLGYRHRILIRTLKTGRCERLPRGRVFNEVLLWAYDQSQDGNRALE